MRLFLSVCKECLVKTTCNELCPKYIDELYAILMKYNNKQCKNCSIGYYHIQRTSQYASVKCGNCGNKLVDIQLYKFKIHHYANSTIVVFDIDSFMERRILKLFGEIKGMEIR